MDLFQGDNAKGQEGAGPAEKPTGSGALPIPSPPPSPEKKEAEPSGFMGGLRVSLMPSGEREEKGADMRRQLVILFAVLIIETIIIGGAFLFVSKREAEANVHRQELQQTLTEVTQQIRESEDSTKTMTLFDSRVRAATDLLDSHVYWSSLFDYIQSRTKPSVLFLNFSGDYASGVVTLDAMGQTYRDVAEQIVILREDPMVDEVITSSASANIDEVGNILGVSFGMVLKLNQDVWNEAGAGGNGDVVVNGSGNGNGQ